MYLYFDAVLFSRYRSLSCGPPPRAPRCSPYPSVRPAVPLSLYACVWYISPAAPSVPVPALPRIALSFLTNKQAPAGKTKVQLEEEARAFALRFRDVSKYAWAEFVQVANTGTSFGLGAAKLNADISGGGEGRATAVGATPLCSSSPGVSPRPSGSTVLGGGGGGSRSSPTAGEPPPANPLQAAFLNRVCLLEIDDEHKAKLQRWWVATRTWSWGYQKQLSCDRNLAKEEKEVREAAEEAERMVAAATEEKPKPVRKGPHGESPQQLTSGNLLSLEGGRRGLPRMFTARPSGVGDPTRERMPPSGTEVKGHQSLGSGSVGPTTSTEVDGASGAPIAGGGLAADGSHAQQAQSTAVIDEVDKSVEAPLPADWARDVWSQCRLHRVSTSPLLLPMASSTLRGFSVDCSAKGQDDAGEAVSLVVEAGFRSPKGFDHFSGSWGEGCTEEENQYGPGRWDPSDPFGRRGLGGSGVVGSISEKDGVVSPKAWGGSSHNSPVVTQYSSSVTEGANTRFGGAGGSAAGFLSRDRHLMQPEFEEEIEVLRSRSATSSGPGRDSLDSNVELEDRLDPAATLPSRLQVARGGVAGDYSRGFGSSWTAALGGEASCGGDGEPRQTRSASFAGWRWDGGDSGSGEAGGMPFPSLRRKSSAVDKIGPEVAATPGSVATSTPTARGENAAVAGSAAGTAEVERAVMLARQFVVAYSSYLVEHLGFTLVGGPSNGVVDTTAATSTSTKDSNDIPRTRPGFARDTTTSASSQSVGASGWGESPTDGGGGGGGGGFGGGSRGGAGRANDHFCSPATRDSGGFLLAHALLRLAFELTNTVALVEVSVMVASLTSTAAPTAAAVAAEPMRASVKFWTVDVTEPSGGWEGGGPIGGSVEGKSASRSWWADLPTLTSFKWNLDPDNPAFQGCDLPEDLPHDMYRIIHKLRFRNSVEDFIVGQVSLAPKLNMHACAPVWSVRPSAVCSSRVMYRKCFRLSEIIFCFSKIVHVIVCFCHRKCRQERMFVLQSSRATPSPSEFSPCSLFALLW